MKMKLLLFGLSITTLLAGCGQPNLATNELVRTPDKTNSTNMTIGKVTKTEAEWQKQLTPEQNRVARKQGTERAFIGEHHENGIYRCVACEHELFDSAAKFESGTGWPSFHTPLANHIGTEEDNSFFVRRTEVYCARCDSDLGHVFNDGPNPAGLRYCISSASLKFEKAK